MEIYEALKNWLLTEHASVGIDRLGHNPGELAIFPQGVQLLRQWEDVLGNRYRKVRYRFWVRLVLPAGEAAAKLVLRLQQEAPKVGFQATEGSLRKTASDGLAIYEIRFITEREEKL